MIKYILRRNYNRRVNFELFQSRNTLEKIYDQN